MSKYGDVAVKAATAIQSNNGEKPRDIWDLVASDIFGEGSSSQKKGCPRNAFLGLCEEGMIKGVQKGKYTSSKANKKYALKAVEILKENPVLVNDSKTLWLEVIEEPKKHNGQMDVVISLWKHGLIG
jgi:hypothetical protein